MPVELVELDEADLSLSSLHLNGIQSRLPSSSVLLGLVSTWLMYGIVVCELLEAVQDGHVSGAKIGVAVQVAVTGYLLS